MATASSIERKNESFGEEIVEEEEGGIPGREEKTALMIQVRAVSPAPRRGHFWRCCAGETN